MAVQNTKEIVDKPGFVSPQKAVTVSRTKGGEGSSANRLGAPDASGTGASTPIQSTRQQTATQSPTDVTPRLERLASNVYNAPTIVGEGVKAGVRTVGEGILGAAATAANALSQSSDMRFKQPEYTAANFGPKVIGPAYQGAVDSVSRGIENVAGLSKGLVDIAKKGYEGAVDITSRGIESAANYLGKSTSSSPTASAAPAQNYSEDTKTRLAEDAANREKAAAANATNMAANAAKPETSADLSKIASAQVAKGEYAESRPSTYYSPDKGYQQAKGGVKYTLDEKGVPIRTDASGTSSRLGGISGGPGRELTDREKQAVAEGKQRVADWENYKANEARNQQRQMYANMIAGAGSDSGRTVNTGLIAQAQQGLSDLDRQDTERAQLGATGAIAARKGAWEEQKDVADYNLRAREQQFKETSEGQKLALESRKAMEEPLQQLGALSAVGQLTPRMVLDTYRSKLGGAKTKEEVGSKLNDLLDSGEISKDYADIIMSQY